MTQNLLADETSPYLLQHKDNPVHWRPWGREAFDAARQTGRPVLLSVGYAACHWCHVMAHESFEDPQIAALMNELYINIKVDREERPDIDNIYQTALSLLGEQGGWPLTMFLDADAKPFWGGTYFPPTPRYGRPGFSQILNRISELYREEPERIAENATNLSAAVARNTVPMDGMQGVGLDIPTLDAAADHALRLVDPLQGGTHGAPKFPQPGFFRFLWRAYRRNHSESHLNAVTRTLDAICQGGIYDHLGGGFARYSTDAVWLVPHFEKMLYDNAQILELLAEAWQITGCELYAVRARETVEWMLRDMRVWKPDADPADPAAAFAFASAYDADSEGIEGQYYVWALDEITRILGPVEASLFNTAYGVTPGGNWEGLNILNRSHTPGLAAPEDEARLAVSRAKLLAARAERVPPLRDDKVLADWNGLAIAALARAAGVFGRPDWLDAARTAFGFILRNHSESNLLRHSWRAGKARHPAVIDDYANLARAALVLFEATGEAAYLDRARAWTDIANARYWDDAGGGYFMTADDTESLIARPKTIYDNAVPPGNGTMVEVLAKLFHLTGEAARRDRAEALLATFAASAPDQYVMTATLCMGFETLERPVQIVIAGAPAAADTEALLTAARETAPPAHVLLRAVPGLELPDGHPALGKGPIDGKAAAYVCVGPTCGLPHTDPKPLREELSRL